MTAHVTLHTIAADVVTHYGHNLPAARLTLEIATRIDDAASALSTRIEGPATRPVARRAAKKPVARHARRAS